MHSTTYSLNDNACDSILASVTNPYFKLRWVPSSAVCRVRDMFLAKTVAEIETQSDSTIAVGLCQSRGTDGVAMIFCISYGERKCYPRHKLNKYGMFAVPRRQNVFPGSPAQIPFCEKKCSSTTLPFLHQHLLSDFFLMLGLFDKKHSCMTDENFEQQLLMNAIRHFSPDIN